MLLFLFIAGIPGPGLCAVVILVLDQSLVLILVQSGGSYTGALLGEVEADGQGSWCY